MRIAMALIEGHIDVHQALQIQDDTKNGDYTATSSKFLREFPGRLVLYPWKAAMYTVVFFGGGWRDSGIAAICGILGGITEWTLKKLDLSIVKELVVGIITGVVGGFFYLDNPKTCLNAIFMATLHWYFFGTAFVVGLMEILVGQLETGVTRFVGVTVKTFVLSLGACIGLMITTWTGASDAWAISSGHCGELKFDEQWYRVPLYLVCCMSVLGKHRMPLSQYFRALIVQLCAYEAQYEVKYLYKKRLEEEGKHLKDKLYISISNISGAAAAVLTACLVSAVVNRIRTVHQINIQKSGERSNGCFRSLTEGLRKFCTFFFTWSRIGNKTGVQRLKLEERLTTELVEVKDPSHRRQAIDLSANDASLFLETLIISQDLNIWAILTPALYQLVSNPFVLFFKAFAVLLTISSDFFSGPGSSHCKTMVSNHFSGTE